MTSLSALDELDLLDSHIQPDARSGSTPPESLRRRKPLRTRKRVRRSRPNEMAKRGMHQRRNKRMSW